MTKFSDLKLDPKVLQAVAEAGYETPTPIQAQAIPPALEGRDVLGIAQTGTGKTASFTLPLITRLIKGRARARMPRSLVLAPTRELAAQVAENFDVYAKHTRLTKALLIGGVSFKDQDAAIDRGVDVLIATPGRLLDHFERGKLLLTGVEVMVVDEADRMLDMGFIPDIERIFSLTPFTRQTFFYSATMAPEIERITNAFLSNPARVEVARQATTSETIEQGLVTFTPSRRDRAFAEKRAMLRALITAEGEACTNAIIFCNRKMDVDVVAKSLKAHGFNASPIHGDLDQSVRTRTLDGFREGSIRLLVASDVAARGLDIPAVSHVFNIDVPSHSEDYVHRIGRTGRAGRLGKALTIATPSDEKYVAGIENLIKKPIPPLPAPEIAFDDRPERGEHAPARSLRTRVARDEDRRGGAKRGDDRRRDARDRPVKPHGQEASMTPLEVAQVVVAPAPAAADEAPAPKRERRRAPSGDAAPEPRAEARAEPRPERRREDRPAGRTEGRTEGRPEGRAQPRERTERSERSDRGVVGMGEHMPDFLLRSFARPARPAEDEGGDAEG
ncbi:MAG: DEAD/DEAH box helicase [Gemmobacter sp.]